MDHEQRLDEVITAYLKAVEAGQGPDPAEWLARYPELADDLREFLAEQQRLDRVAAPLRELAPAAGGNNADMLTVVPGEMTATVPAPGTVRYIGDYELLSEIARGGMGVVYKARQKSLDRIVALKMIGAGRLATDAEVQRFRTEAEAAAQIEHENIVPVYEVGEERGQRYFSMAYIEGGTLADRLGAGPLPPREAAELVRRLALAVQYAHDRGIVHRDLKPANVLLASPVALAPGVARGADATPLAQCTPKIADFGLAKRVQKTDGPTLSGHILGTPSYMPPEQAGGHVNLVGPLADVYGLGGILYAGLTGRAPFQAATDLDTLLQVMEKEPARPSSLNPAVPRDLETICLKCLEKRLERRYRSAQELADDLGRFLRYEPIRARPAGLFRQAWTWARQRPWVISAAIGLLLLVSSCLAYALWAHARQMRADALYYQVRATRLELQTGTVPDNRRDRMLEESWQRLREAARAAGSFPTAHLYDEALALLQLEGRAGHRLLLPPTTAKQVERLTGTAAQVSAAGKRVLVTGSTTRRLPLSPTTARQVERLTGTAAQVSVAGKLVLVTGRTAEVLVLEVDTGKIVHSAVASHAALDPRGQLLALAGKPPEAKDKSPGPIRLVRLPDGKEVETLPRQEEVVALAFSPDGQRLAVAGKGVDLWDLGRKRRTMSATGQSITAASLSFSRDGRRLASAFQGYTENKNTGRVVVWDVESGHEIASFVTDFSLTGVALSPDGRRVAWAGWHNELVQMVNLDDTDHKTRFRWGPPQPWYAWQPILGPSFFLAGPVAFSPDGRFLATWRILDTQENQEGDLTIQRGNVLLWEAESGQEYLRLPGARFAGFAADGSLFTVRHPLEGDIANVRLDQWKPEEIRAILPDEMLSSMRAPYAYRDFWTEPSLARGFVPLSLVVFIALVILHRLARKALGGYDVEGGWRGAASLTCMTMPGLVMIGLGFYYGLTFFDHPSWQWGNLAVTGVLSLVSINWGMGMLHRELRAYHRALTGEPAEGPKKAAPGAEL